MFTGLNVKCARKSSAIYIAISWTIFRENIIINHCSRLLVCVIVLRRSSFRSSISPDSSLTSSLSDWLRAQWTRLPFALLSSHAALYTCRHKVCWVASQAHLKTGFECCCMPLPPSSPTKYSQNSFTKWLSSGISVPQTSLEFYFENIFW